MSCCYLIGSMPFDFKTEGCARPAEDDLVICADGGYDRAQEQGILPDILVGDFDSANGYPADFKGEVVRLVPEKDDTDMLSAAKLGLARGYNRFILLGGYGGRFDHTVANLQLLSFLLDHDAKAVFYGGGNRIWMIDSETTAISAEKNCYLSVFAYGGNCSGVTLRGLKYPLEDAELSVSFPIGVSNEFIENQAVISVKKGRLLLVLSPKGV